LKSWMNQKKLKRGLKDISPLFQGASKKTPQVAKPVDATPVIELANEPLGTQCLAVFSPEILGDSLLLSTFLASKLATFQRPCSILSLNTMAARKQFGNEHSVQSESYGKHIRRLSLSWDEFESLNDQPVSRVTQPEKSHLLFVEFEHSQLPYVEKVIPILDKWIVLVKPSLESISEAYKMMKAAIPLNRHLEFYMLFSGSSRDPRCEMLFERFSELCARRLGIDLMWLGCLDFSQGSGKVFGDLSLEHLFLKSSTATDSVEKRALEALLITESDRKVVGI